MSNDSSVPGAVGNSHTPLCLANESWVRVEVTYQFIMWNEGAIPQWSSAPTRENPYTETHTTTLAKKFDTGDRKHLGYAFHWPLGSMTTLHRNWKVLKARAL